MNTLTNGQYTARIENVKVEESKVTFECVIVSGEAKGFRFHKISNLKTDAAFQYFRGEIAKLGMAIGSANEIPLNVERLHGMLVRITKTDKGGFPQYYFMGAFDQQQDETIKDEPFHPMSDDEARATWNRLQHYMERKMAGSN